MAGQKATQAHWLVAAALMLTAIFMVVFSLVLANPINGRLNIVAAVFLFLFNLTGLRSHPSHYDRMLILASLVFNILTIWYAFNWAWS